MILAFSAVLDSLFIFVSADFAGYVLALSAIVVFVRFFKK